MSEWRKYRNFSGTALGLVGKVLVKWVRDESQLALLTIEIGLECQRQGKLANLNEWHDYMKWLRDERDAEKKR